MNPSAEPAARLKAVVAAVLCRQGEVLLCRRGPGDKHAGAWEFPGGKVEQGESPGEAARREIREELGLEIGEPREFLRHRLPEHGIELIFLIAACPAGDPQLSVHDRCEWLPPHRSAVPGLLAGDLPAAAWLAQSCPAGPCQAQGLAALACPS